MDIQKLRKMKKKAGLTNGEIASLSGIPVSTVNKIFSGATRNPRYATLLAVEEVLATKEKLPFVYDELNQEPVLMREPAMAYQYQARQYGNEDIEKLPEWARAELIKGRLYLLAAPGRMHQFLVTRLLVCIDGHIQQKKGNCQVYPAPFDVYLFGVDSTVVQPDLTVVCDKEKLTEKGCIGAPDWIIEIASESSFRRDYGTKMIQYQKSGVREYWIIDPAEKKVAVFNFENSGRTDEFSFTEEVTSGVLDGLTIKMSDFDCQF